MTPPSARRPPAECLRALDAPHQKLRILGLEVPDQAVYLRIHQLVAVTQPQPLLPCPVVNAQAVARDAVLQGSQHQRDGILHRSGGNCGGHQFAAGDHHARILLRRTEQIAQPLQETAPGARNGRRVQPHDASERRRVGRNPLPGTDQVADVLVEQTGRGTGADRAPQAHRAPFLVGEQPRDAVQAHRLQRIPVARQHPQRVDTAPHRAQFAFVTRLVGLVAGDHQLPVTFGLIEMVKGPADGAVLGLQLHVTAVGSGKTNHDPVDIPHREHTDRDQQDIARDHLRLDEFRLLHSAKDRKKVRFSPDFSRKQAIPKTPSPDRGSAAAAGTKLRRLRSRMRLRVRNRSALRRPQLRLCSSL